MIVTAWLVVQLAIGLVFLHSGLAKLRNPQSFVAGLASYRVLPAKTLRAAGISVIALELLLAGSFLSGVGTRLALPVALLLTSAFAVGALAVIIRGHTARCLCFGSSDEVIGVRTVVRIALLLASIGALATRPAAVAGWPVSGLDVRAFVLDVICAALLLDIIAWGLSTPDLFALGQKCRSCAERIAQRRRMQKFS